MTDEISDLRLFARIVAAGSLSEAARRLRSSLPAVSRRLAALEARLGVRLIERGPRRFTLTEEGSLLNERSIAILRDVDAAEAEASSTAKHPRGHLRIGTHVEIGRRRISPLVAEFTARYPGISAELVLTDARLDVVDDEMDVVMHIVPPSAGGVVSRVVLSSRLIVCAAPKYAATHRALKRPADLLDHDCIRLVAHGRPHLDYWRFKEDDRVSHVQVSGRLSTSSGEVMHDWALSGRGVAQKLLWDVEQDVRAGRLIHFLEPFECEEAKLYLSYASRTHLSPRVRLFIDFLVAALRVEAGVP